VGCGALVLDGSDWILSPLIRIRALSMCDHRTALGVLALLLVSPASAQTPQPAPADLVVLNGRVITVDPAFASSRRGGARRRLRLPRAATRMPRSSSARTRA
jgi:hypothetical protein